MKKRSPKFAIKKQLFKVKRFGICYVIYTARYKNWRERRLPQTLCMKGERYYKNLSTECYAGELCQWYYYKTGKSLNLINPVTMNEKIQWLKLNDTSKKKTLLSDKWAVRKWVEEKIGAEYLIPILGLWERANEIDFDFLPKSFVLKCNHGSGTNIIVRDKSIAEKADIIGLLNGWMSVNYAFISGGMELQYDGIKRRIIAEKYIEDSCHTLMDYKFLCFNGKAKLIWVDVDRFNNHRRNVYDLEWKRQPFTIAYPNVVEDVQKPCNLEAMIEIANTLSEGFYFVRVDLYNVDGKIYFGEMTFSSGNGIESIAPYKYDVLLGNMIELPL